jgi:hypothetical protein
VQLDWTLVFKSNFLKCHFQLSTQSTKREPERFVSIATSLDENLEPAQDEGMIVVAGHGQQCCISTQVLDQLHHVLAGVLGWMTTTLKMIDGCRDDKQEE